MLESNLDTLVANILTAYGIELSQGLLRRFGRSSFRPDFMARGPGGARTAIEVRQADVDARVLYLLYAWYDEARTRGGVDRLLLVTAEPPSEGDRRRFDEAFDRDETAQWIGLKELPNLLGISGDIDLASPQALDRLKTASLIRKARVYRSDVVGLGGMVEEPRALGGDLTVELKLPKSLTRQLSIKALIDIERTGQPPEKALRIGQELRPYVLLSDIKSFSTLVRVGDANVVQEMMSTYYRRARDIIWAHGGALDKFLGDSVLAIWGYPEATGQDASNVVRAAADLIGLGRSLLDEFQSRHNEVIDSGTRVGIASDDVLVLNIGTDEAELSFVGNAINLASRLEAACVVDGVLMDNRTDAGLAGADAELHRLAGTEEVVLDEQHVKGQLMRIRAWQVTPDGVDRILRGKESSASRALA
jgi:adenylate cyclase